MTILRKNGKNINPPAIGYGDTPNTTMLPEVHEPRKWFTLPEIIIAAIVAVLVCLPLIFSIEHVVVQVIFGGK